MFQPPTVDDLGLDDLILGNCTDKHVVVEGSEVLA
jgi:hypothetical protein